MPFTKETARAAGLKRAAQFTTESQAAAARAHSSAHQAEIGKRGAASTIKKHGRDFFFNQIVKIKKANPTYGEQFVAALLVELGISFEFNAPLEGKWIVDFLIDRRVIEFNGGIHNAPVYDTARHERKIAGLREAGYQVIEIDDAGLDTAVDTIREFLGVKY